MHRVRSNRSEEILAFFFELLCAPLGVGALFPSGRCLADRLTSMVTPTHSPVIELGPGTGVITRRLIEKGIAEERLVLIESGRRFVRCLRQHYPLANVLHADASEISVWPGGLRAGAVISALPLRTMSQERICKILRCAVQNMRSDGAIYQFTYLPTTPVSRSVLSDLGLTAEFLGMVVRNFPPAFVFKISRAAGVRQAGALV